MKNEKCCATKCIVNDCHGVVSVFHGLNPNITAEQQSDFYNNTIMYFNEHVDTKNRKDD